ncbi:MAG TPA: hypothetical protein DCE44_16085, partial [Verrucomicrobiales bacterium]|nr:hypothetical protein [Verrucomicrobiales bacterium]
MNEASDHELVQAYALRGDQAAFTRLVERHLPLVYSTARRRLGATGCVEDVVQQAFTLLARKSSTLTGRVILAGWLYRTTSHLAARTQRSEERRLAREQTAVTHMDNPDNPSIDNTWREIASELDQAMEVLGDLDRDALVLRYFQNKSLRDVGRALGTTDDAAQKRLARALEKLRRILGDRGHPVGAPSLSAAILHCAVEPAPAALAQTISTAVLSSTALTVSTTTANAFIMNSSLVKPLVVGIATVSAAIGLVVQRQQVQTSRAEIVALQARLAESESSLAEPFNPVANAVPQLSRDERAELLRLRGEVSRLRNELAQAKDSGGLHPQASSESLDPAMQDELAVRKAARINELKHVGLGIRVLNTELLQNPALKAKLTNLSETLPQHLISSEILPAEALANVEILVPSVEWMIAVEQYPQAIMARGTEAYPNPDGSYVRVYCLGDGSVQEIRHETAEESYGWGQIIDGTRPDWLVLRTAETATTAAEPQTALQMDPKLARRY